MESLLSIKDRLPRSGSCFVDVDWLFVSRLTTVLKPVAILTTRLQAEQYTAGDFMRDYLIMTIDLEKINGRSTSAIVMFMIEELQICLKKRDKAFQHPAILAALYMDPRFNNGMNTESGERMSREQLNIGRVSLTKYLYLLSNKPISILRQSIKFNLIPFFNFILFLNRIISASSESV